MLLHTVLQISKLDRDDEKYSRYTLYFSITLVAAYDADLCK